MVSLVVYVYSILYRIRHFDDNNNLWDIKRNAPLYILSKD